MLKIIVIVYNSVYNVTTNKRHETCLDDLFQYIIFYIKILADDTHIIFTEMKP